MRHMESINDSVSKQKCNCTDMRGTQDDGLALPRSPPSPGQVAQSTGSLIY